MLGRQLYFLLRERETNSDTFMKQPVRFDVLDAQSPGTPLSDTHDAGLATAIRLPKCRVLIDWGQYSAAQIVLFFRFGSCLEILELELAQPIS